MSTNLESINELLYNSLMPCTMREVKDTKFKEMLNELPKPIPNEGMSWNIDFMLPVTSKRKFYFQITQYPKGFKNYKSGFKE